MISSFASVFVANANATPENVVPFVMHQVSRGRTWLSAQSTYKIYAHDELGFVSARRLDLDRSASSVLPERWLRRSSMHPRCPLVAARILRWLRSAAQGRMALWIRTGIDRRRVMRNCLLGSRRHRTRRAGSVGVVRVAGRATQGVLHAG